MTEYSLIGYILISNRPHSLIFTILREVHLNKYKLFRVKILDFSYMPDFTHLTFRYLLYEVQASHKEEAIEKGRDLYIRGEKALNSEELPFLLKLFLMDD